MKNYVWKRLAVAALSLALVAMPSVSFAADIRITTDRVGTTSIITVLGEITDGDADRFRRAAATLPHAVVLLASRGGNLTEAIDIGRIIRVKGYATGVLDETICASSCALMWLAGTTRNAQAHARIGFHAGYVMDNGAPVSDAVANAIIGRYITQLDLPEKTVIFATLAKPEQILWLNTANPGAEGIPYKLQGPFSDMTAVEALKEMVSRGRIP